MLAYDILCQTLYRKINEVRIMALQSQKRINPQFKKEYKSFIEEYLFPLLGVWVDEDPTQIRSLEETEELAIADNNVIIADNENRTIYFTASGYTLFRLVLREKERVEEESLRMARRIIESFFFVSRNNRTGSGKQIASRYFSAGDSGSASFKRAVYNFAVQKGVCGWVVDHSSSKNMERFFDILEDWSVKTYEGRKISLGFIFDLEEHSPFDDAYGDWLKFLSSDNAAVLSDCIHSVIVLDPNCNYVRHMAISDGDIFPECDASHEVPLRFTQIIRKHVVGENRSGVFLLSNGDIILAKKQKVCFVKRNNKWLNFSYSAFNNALIHFRERYSVDDILVQSIYASALDVSFSHTGGILAIVGDPWSKKTESLEDSVLNHCDNLLNGKQLKELFDEEKEQWRKEEISIKEVDMEKRLLKRNVIQSLVNHDKFPDIGRKLRSELISLDGACIINCAGEVYSFGAIIRYDSGSPTGGRGAAASKLSAYGMAVKISTDGYLELYVNQKKVYEIK